MGLFSMSTGSSVGQVSPVPKGNPDPSNFAIINHRQIGAALVLLVRYPDCTNYEGHKILVFENQDLHSVQEIGFLDPHFMEHSRSPVARFEPTNRGWRLAILLAGLIPSDAELVVKR